MTPPLPRFYSTADVSRALGISSERVRQLDQLLRPWRTPAGFRVYDPEHIEVVREERKRARAKGRRHEK